METTKKVSRKKLMATALLIVTIAYAVALALRAYQYQSWLAENTAKLEGEGWFVSPKGFYETSEGMWFFVGGIGLFVVCLVAVSPRSEETRVDHIWFQERHKTEGYSFGGVSPPSPRRAERKEI